jgi:hypothetical protein
MKIAEQLHLGEGAAVLLVCARCKRPVEPGRAHECTLSFSIRISDTDAGHVLRDWLAARVFHQGEQK